ncbi:hypothetical protein [Terriglobus tenax]|uniref:hypothetical protein n=1 Tax=Terriglobus tenax TaxID=1111115 RepID=UPI0021E04730|nr:hypothetical protein [Terriglobus tenax]
MSVTVREAAGPAVERVRAYFAPVDRESGNATVFDPATDGRFAAGSPPEAWVDLGWVSGFKRSSGSKVVALENGAPAIATAQARQETGASVELSFQAWGKLQMALAGESQAMNVLAPAEFVVHSGSGGTGANAVPVLSGSTATVLQVGSSVAAGFAVGDVVAVDVDYGSQVGFVGSGMSGAYVRSADAVAGDANYVRRVSWNVGRIVAVTGGALTLASPLLAGTPDTSMKVSKVLGFADREGGSFFPEWSALFVADGAQGDRVLFHYPRLQPMKTVEEAPQELAGSWEQWGLKAAFRALPVTDPNDGERVVCFRTYLPAQMRAV